MIVYIYCYIMIKILEDNLLKKIKMIYYYSFDMMLWSFKVINCFKLNWCCFLKCIMYGKLNE